MWEYTQKEKQQQICIAFKQLVLFSEKYWEITAVATGNLNLKVQYFAVCFLVLIDALSTLSRHGDEINHTKMQTEK